MRCNGTPAHLQGLAYRITRRARNLAHQRDLLARETIQQAGFPCIGRTHQNDLCAFAQDAALFGQTFDAGDFVHQVAQFGSAELAITRFDLFLRKIQRGFDQHAQVDEHGDRLVNGCREIALQGTHGAARGLFGGGIDQISHAFSLRQVHFVVKKGALREFARLGEARTQLQAALQYGLQHRRAAMALEFQHLFPGIGMGRRKEQRDALIQRTAVSSQKGGVGGESGE